MLGFKVGMPTETGNMNATELRGFFTGLMLGDGQIGKGIQKRPFELQTKHEDFARYIISSTDDISPFTWSIEKTDTWTVRTKSHPYFSKRYPYFYNDFRAKRLSREAIHWLNLQGWANFYMMNGFVTNIGKKSRHITDCRVDFCTDKFTKSECERLAASLQEKFGFRTSLIPRKSKFRIRLAKTSAMEFFTQINPYVTQSLKSKLLMNFPSPQKWFSNEYHTLWSSLKSAEYPSG